MRSGRVNPNAEKAIARHEVHLKLPELLAACRRFLKPTGRFYMVHRLNREKEVLLMLEKFRFRVRYRKSTLGQDHKNLLLIEAELQNADNEEPI
jgi:tRNA1Val (adenine37-N6)-methyltransferase